MSANTLVQVLVPAGALALLILVLRRRGVSVREELALCWPGLLPMLAWLAAFIVLAVIEARLEPVLGVAPAGPWGHSYGTSERLFRALGIVLVAPTVEEAGECLCGGGAAGAVGGGEVSMIGPGSGVADGPGGRHRCMMTWTEFWRFSDRRSGSRP